jgi:tetratricopeptide (TPR) repeat protein
MRPHAHLDLLFPARRVWRGRLPDCSLGTLERAVLGHERGEDVPGWAIPSLYFGFLRRGACAPMRQVFAHNQDDVLSLASLVARLGRLLGDPIAVARHPRDLLAVGRMYEEQGDASVATECYEHGLTLCTETEARRPLLVRLAALHKRLGDRQRAAELWQQLADEGLGDDVSPLVELAKHHEHRVADLVAAIDLVQQALAIVELRALRRKCLRAQDERRQLERRLARLLRKASAERLGLPQ